MPDIFFEKMLNPEILNLNLKVVATFIAIYESFKENIIENVKGFYCTGIKDGELIYEGYEAKVLNKIKSKKNKQIRATILWFLENGAIDEADKLNFKDITDERNRLTHDMIATLSEGLTTKTLDLLSEMLKLYEKMEKWWITEIVIPTDLDLLERIGNAEIDYDGVKSMKLEFLKVMMEIALTDTKEYHELYKEGKK